MPIRPSKSTILLLKQHLNFCANVCLVNKFIKKKKTQQCFLLSYSWVASEEEKISIETEETTTTTIEEATVETTTAGIKTKINTNVENSQLPEIASKPFNFASLKSPVYDSSQNLNE